MMTSSTAQIAVVVNSEYPLSNEVADPPGVVRSSKIVVECRLLPPAGPGRVYSKRCVRRHRTAE